MSKVSSEKKLGNIDDECILIIDGFIREAQSLLPRENTFYNIPPSITHIILLFYYIQMDEFELFPSCFTPSDDNKTVIKTDGTDWASACGKIGIESQSNIRCFWKLKLIKESSPLFIGISAIRY